MKAERQRKQAILKAKEDELRRKKLDYDRLEIQQREYKRSGEFLPSTLVVMKEETHQKETLKIKFVKMK